MDRNTKIVKWLESGVFGRPDLPGGLPESVGQLADPRNKVKEIKDGGPKGVCFVAGTVVLTSDGPRKIEDIRVGDRVITSYRKHCPWWLRLRNWLRRIWA